MPPTAGVPLLKGHRLLASRLLYILVDDAESANLVGMERIRGSCQRIVVARNVAPALGEPTPPRLVLLGKTGKTGMNDPSILFRIQCCGVEVVRHGRHWPDRCSEARQRPQTSLD